MPITKIKNSRGFSIIELVIYSGLVAIVIGGSLGAVYYISSGSESLDRAIIREQEIRFIMDKINWVMADTAAIMTPAENSTSSVLTITKQAFSQNPVKIQMSGTGIALQQSTNPETILHSDVLQISGLEFEHIMTTTTPHLITVRFMVGTEEYKTKTYIQL